MSLSVNMFPPQLHDLVFAVLELHLWIMFTLLQLGHQTAVALLVFGVHIMIAGRTTLKTLQLTLELED